MSIFDNVAAGLRLTGTKGVDLRSGSTRRCAPSVCGTRSRTASTRPGVGLSGGQQQRLCIARSVAVEPEVILMDEPCSALDPIATLRIEELIDELKERYTIVIVTHNMQQAARSRTRRRSCSTAGWSNTRRRPRSSQTPRDERTERYVTGKFG